MGHQGLHLGVCGSELTTSLHTLDTADGNMCKAVTYTLSLSPFLLLPNYPLLPPGPASFLLPLLPASVIATASLLPQGQAYHEQLVLGHRQEKTSELGRVCSDQEEGKGKTNR